MEKVKIGWAKNEYSLDVPCNINGQMYMRRSQGIHDPLYVTALAIDGGENQDAIIFCAIDMTVLRGGIIQATVDYIKEHRPDIPAEAIIMNATHTHTSMDVTTKLEKFIDGSPLYNSTKTVPHLTNIIIKTVIEAWDNRKTGAVAYGYGYAVVAHSRRVVYSVDKGKVIKTIDTQNGHAVMYGKTNDPTFSGYEAGADHFLNAMFTFDENEKLTGMIINIPCPSQTSEHFLKLSADYWCEVRKGVEETFGEGVFVLPQCAAAGDLSPRILHYKKAQERRMALKYGLVYDFRTCGKNLDEEYKKCMAERYDIAERILDGVKDVYSWAKKDIQSEIAVRHERMDTEVSRRMITPEEAQECRDNLEMLKTYTFDTEGLTEFEINKQKNKISSAVSRNKVALERYEEQDNNRTIPTILHAVQIGEIGFCTNRFEYYMDFMHRIQARSPFIQTFVVQLAGCEGGSYLPTERANANKGYGCTLFSNQVGPEGGQEIVEKSLQMLENLKAKDEA